MQRKVSYAQNAEDIRVWRAFHSLGRSGPGLTFVDVGANEPRHLSITASLHDLGWRGLLIEADPDLAEQLRALRPGDTVVQVAAASGPGELTFYRVPGTGLGTLDAAEAEAARERGFDVEAVIVPTDSLDSVLDAHGLDEIHFMSVDVEGAEAQVLQGLGLRAHRPWVMCIEAVLPGTATANHQGWENRLTRNGYRFAAFDGVNRWYVAEEHLELVEPIAVPFNAIDAGEHGWITHGDAAKQQRVDRSTVRRAWQREVILNDIRGEVPKEEYERQIDELRSALVAVEGSRSFRLTRSFTSKGKGLVFRAKSAVNKLPGPVQRAVVRKRHLKHVTANMADLTPAAFLGNPVEDIVDWMSPDGLPDAPTRGLDLRRFTSGDAAHIRDWIDGGPYDSDELLARRIDNHGDELGRAMSAMKLRLDLAERPMNPTWAGGNRVLFDARCLQTAAFGNRGIGRFAKAALMGVREAISDDRITLLVDHGFEELPHELAGDCAQVTRITERTLPAFSVLVQPSPMTSSPAPLLPILHSNAHKIAVVFDFIPMHYPTVYLGNVAARLEYAAALDSLRLYDDFVCISHVVRKELADILGRQLTGPDALPSVVAWPREVLPKEEMTKPGKGNGPVIVMTGDDPRKNTFGALAAIGAATAGADDREVIVIGMAGQGTRVHHWSIAAAMRPGEATTVDRITDNQMHDLLADSGLVVVPSFDEGLSLPVIEAVRAGATVVASDIPSHRELIGAGSYLADPRSPSKMAAAIRKHMGKSGATARQRRRLTAHQHAPLEAVIAKKVTDHAKPAAVAIAPSQVYTGGRNLRVAVVGPWRPQRTGVADFTVATILELAAMADVTVFTTSDADVTGSIPEGVHIDHRPLAQLREIADQFDVIVAVMGNSHFHLPLLQVIDDFDCVVITHDTRLVELYLSLRDRGGVEDLMLRGTGRSRLSPSLDEQIDDMRLLESTAFWEVARRSRMLIAHTPTAAPRMAEETGRPIHLLPFANYRSPDVETVSDQMREAARVRLGWDQVQYEGTIHLGSFGFIDTRTKMTDVVLEAAAWLSQWGHRVSLHLVGSATVRVHAELMARAQESGIANVEITGYIDDDTFRDYILAVDLGVQLRVSPLLGVSGPLSDMAAYGTPAIASQGLAADVDAPAFIDRLPDDVSPVMVAEAIEYRLAHQIPAQERERMRREYLLAKSPVRYAEQLLTLLTDVARSPKPGES